MPHYDYCCDACQHKFETFQSITAELLKKCPNCGFKMLRRLIGKGGGVIFCGKDWPGRDIARGGVKDEKPKTETST
jgi:putative FmdB family regulatory protein